MTARAAITAGALFAFVAVAAGAFGAHALRSRLAPDALAVWHTAVQYHGWHALALLAAGLLLAHRPNARGAAVAAASFAAGIVLFSGSLYALALTGVREFGAVTPFGGAAFLVGWGALAVSGWRSG